MKGPAKRNDEPGSARARMTPAETARAALAAMEAMSEILQAMAADLAQSRKALAAAFQSIAARFAQVHSIALAGEAGGAAATADTLHALRAVVDALTVELQFEDTLGQRLGHAAGKIDAAGVALSEARSLMGGAADGDADSTGHALTVLARTLDSIRNAMDPGAPQPASGGAIELF
ncbi:MAG: hypothetical protein OEV81_10165 [Betaproteobacteria bacterium]|nr:hypothetical protein [Betaproteobacteria bacterium]MDH5220004.1 hypothetical protein [Betaproteobacteria bacterium]MDH5350646.1 hypothetical protein [Betaproteobacteria bacterium]